MKKLIDRYCEAWNEPDAGRRERILEEVWAEGGTYTDPGVRVTGRAELSAHIGRAVTGRPGARVLRTSVVDAHHGLARFSFRVVGADGAVLREGLDLAELAGDGKLARIVGFFGPLAALTTEQS